MDIVLGAKIKLDSIRLIVITSFADLEFAWQHSVYNCEEDHLALF